MQSRASPRQKKRQLGTGAGDRRGRVTVYQYSTRKPRKSQYPPQPTTLEQLAELARARARRMARAGDFSAAAAHLDLSYGIMRFLRRRNGNGAGPTSEVTE